MNTTIRVEGLRETTAALGRLDPELRKGMRKELRGIGRLVSDEARSIAGGFAQTGDTRRGVKPTVRGTTAIVRSTASHRGFNYPRRLEFETGGRGRPHLAPALDRKRGQVVERIEELVDRVIDSFEG